MDFQTDIVLHVLCIDKYLPLTIEYGIMDKTMTLNEILVFNILIKLFKTELVYFLFCYLLFLHMYSYDELCWCILAYIIIP
jgi:hypothetical protein